MLLFLLYQLTRALLGALIVLCRREMSKDAELLVLRHENAVLRRQISRVRYTAADRIWLAAVARVIPRRRWREIFTVAPATVLAWHRRLVTRKWDYRDRRRPGRRPTPAPIKILILRMAQDNPGWGIGASRVSWSGSVTGSPPPRCGRSLPLRASIRIRTIPPRHGSPKPPGTWPTTWGRGSRSCAS